MDVESITEEQMFEILQYCAKTNTYTFNMNKALEECVEFQEVLLKLQTKSPEKQPDKVEAIKEFGDLFYRGLIALMTIFPELSEDDIHTQMAEHIKIKLTTLHNYKKEAKYLGGL